MKTFYKSLIVLILVLLKTQIIHPQWVQTNVPGGEDVYCFAVSGTNIFAGTIGSGIYRSLDNGTNWTQVNNGLTNTQIRSLAISGSNIFAGTNGGAFLSNNNGTNWAPINNGLTNPYILSLAVSGSNIFACTYGSGIFRTTNNGTTWTQINNGLPSTYTEGLAVSGSNIFAGSGGVVLSTNNGTNWMPVNTGLTNTYIHSFAVIGSNIFVGTEGWVFLSTNNGSNWTQVLANGYVHSLAVNTTNIFAGTDANGVYLSTNNGTNWTQVNGGLTNNNVRALAVNETNIFAGTGGAGVWMRPLSDLPIPVIGDYQSAQSGNWRSLSTWQTWNGTSWDSSKTIPDSNTTTSVNILSGHNITISSAFADTFGVRNVNINSGATVTVTAPAVLYIAKAGMMINGTLTIGGNAPTAAPYTITVSPTSTLIIGATGVVNYNQGAVSSSTKGALPQATWLTGSTLNINSTGGAGATGWNAGTAQNFYNLNWNCPVQTGSFGWGFNANTIGGTVTISATNTGRVQFFGGSSGALTIMGDLNILGTSNVTIQGTISATNDTINVYGKVNVNTTGNFSLAQGSQNGTGTSVFNFYGDSVKIIAGTMQNSDTNANGAKFVFKKSGTQYLTLTPTTASGNAFPIQVDEGSTVSLVSPVNVTTLYLNGGLITSSASNPLIMGWWTGSSLISGDVSPTAPGSSTSYISGPMAYLYATAGGTTTKNYPIGKGGIYRPLSFGFTQTSATLSTYTAEMINGTHTSLTLPSSLSSVSSVRYYSLVETAGGSAFTDGSLLLNYGTDDLVANPASLRIAWNNDGGGWLNLGGTGSAPIIGNIRVQGLTTNCDFILATASGLLTEDFNYTAGTLLTADGWTAHSGAGTNPITVTTTGGANGLSYTGYAGDSVGLSVTLAASGEDDNKLLYTPVISGSIYVAAMIKVTSVGIPGYFFHLGTGSSTFYARLFAQASGGGFQFGISKSTESAVYESTVRTLGQTYLVVMKYTYGDVVKVYVNPTLAVEPGSSTVSSTGTSDISSSPGITAVYLRQGSIASILTIDGIRAGTTWGDVIPTTGGANIGDFRSAGSGNWDNLSTWQTWNGTSWVASATIPDSNISTAVTIPGGQNITISSAATFSVCNVTVNSGATVTVTAPAVLYIAKSGMTVNGTLTIEGNAPAAAPYTVTVSPASSLIIGATGTVNYNQGAISASTKGALPTATWQAGSTLNVNSTGGAASTGWNAGTAQNFYNLNWNCPSQTGSFGWGFTNNTIGGTVTISATNTGRVQFFGGSSGALTIMGDLNVLGSANAAIQGTTSATYDTIHVFGKVNVNTTGNFSLALGSQSGTGTSVFNFYGDSVKIIAGTMQNSDTNANGAKFVFKKSGTQYLTLTPTTASGNAFPIQVDAGSTVSLLSPVNVTTLYLNGGLITSSASNPLIMGWWTGSSLISGNVSPTAPGSSTSFVSGPLAFLYATAGGTTTKTYPIGKGGIYRPLSFTFTQTAATLSTYTAEMINGTHPALTLPSSLSSVSSVRYYSIVETAGGSAFTDGSLLLNYGTDDLVTDPSLLRIGWNNDSNTWTDLGGSGSGSGIGFIRAGGFTQNCDFILAKAKSLMIGDFRSAQSGNWDSLSTWQTWNGTSWVASATIPDSNISTTVTILSGHNITIATPLVDTVGVRNVTVNSGANVTVTAPAVLYIAKTGMTVNGTLTIGGNAPAAAPYTVIVAAKDSFIIGAMGVVNYNQGAASSSTKGSLPNATWLTGSTLNVNSTGGAAATGWNAGTAQNFYNLNWNCPLMTGNFAWGFNGNTIGGSVAILNTNTGRVQFFGGSSGALTIMKDFIVSGSANATINGTGTATYDTINIYGKVNINTTGNFSISRGSQGGIGTSVFNFYGDSVKIIAGTMQNSNTSANGAKFVFKKSGTQCLTLTPTTVSSNALPIQVDAGSTVSLASPVNVTTLYLNGGLITSSASNPLIMGWWTGSSLTSGDVSPTAPGSSTSYVSGPMAYLYATAGGTTTKTYPIGKGGIYRPLSLGFTQTSDTLSTYTTEMINGPHPTLTLPSSLSSVSSVRYYSIVEKAGGSSFTNGSLLLNYGTDDLVTDTASLRVAWNNDSNSWIDLGGSGSGPGIGFVRAAGFSVNCDFILATASSQQTLTLTAFIQGFYNGTTMIPDTVTAELHNSASPYTLVSAAKSVLNASGQGTFNFLSAVSGTPYYLVIKHRNAVETWSASPQTLTSNLLSYDFTSTQNQAYASNLVQKGAKWCIYNGDVNQDGIVDSGDLGIVDNDNAVYVSGYTNTDVNGDGIVDSGDLGLVDNNNAAYIGKIVPTRAPTAIPIKKPLKINAEQ